MIRHYRDRLTGRFVSRATWTRSKAHDGTRYKREIERREPPKHKAAAKEAPRQFFGIRTKETAQKLPVVQVIAEIPKPGDLRTWMEISQLVTIVSLYLPVEVRFSDEIRTPGAIMLDEWLSEKRILEADMEAELGEDEYLRIIPMWSVAAFEPEGMNIQAEIE